MPDMLGKFEDADHLRLKVSSLSTQKHKAEFGQFMTPLSVARFMADMFPPSTLQICRLLDAGAGIGTLSRAFLDRWSTGKFDFESVEVTAYEVDKKLRGYLEQNLYRYENVQTNIIIDDYIKRSTSEGVDSPDYTHVILNPPYRKISSQSIHRLALRRVGIETVNLYSAFVALAIAQATLGGQVVAIIPRSFCNGPYYRPFRDFIRERSAIRHIHLFESRSTAFKDDNVLQENVIIRFERGGRQGPVTISTSTDDSFTDVVTHQYPFEKIVFPDDTEGFIHIPTSPENNIIERSSTVNYSLDDLRIDISTGPVVGFRLKEHLCKMPEPGSVPLLYPAHLKDREVAWPLPDIKKQNAIQYNLNTEKWLYPIGFYCVVRRFSTKEEKRRIVASVVRPDVFDGAPMLGFENHLNVFHHKKHGLSEALAYGLMVFLNTTAFDQSFRRFSGHTQVNVTDLKRMKYPNCDRLIAMGQWAMQQKSLMQGMIDSKLETILK